MFRKRLIPIGVGLLLAINAGMLAWSATKHSPTMLEPALLVSGLSHWEFGRFELYRVNPPLVRMVAALPVMAAGYEPDWSGFYESPGARPEFAMGSDFISANGERSIWLFTIARWACIPFSLAGGLFAFFYARELWQSNISGLLALILWCFEPTILAHAELITNDVACTALGLGATWTFWRWLKQPTWGRAGIAGLLLGLAELSKMSWLILFGLWPALWLLWAWRVRRLTQSASSPGLDVAEVEERGNGAEHSTLNTQLAQLAAILLIAIYLINLGYAFDGTFTRLKDFEFISTPLTGLDTSGDPGNRFRGSWLGEVPAPLPKQFVLGFDVQKHDFEDYHRPSYLRGEWKEHGGWWYYYLYGLWVKVPHPVQLLVLLAFLAPLWNLMRQRRESTRRARTTSPERPDSDPHLSSQAPLLSPLGSLRTSLALDQLILLAPGLALFVLVSSQTEINEHFRYALPTLATLLIYAARLGRVFDSPG